MKKPSDQLFRLVKAMTPAEKRYFKMRFASEKAKLTDLFDFLNQMKEYNEDLIKAHFQNGIRKNLKVYKVQLLDLLLKSLTAFRSKKSIRSEIRIGLEEVDLLVEKRLHDLAYQKLEKIKQLALKHEEYTYLLEISYQEYALLYVRIERVRTMDHPIFKEIQQYIHNIQMRHDLALIGNRINDKRRQLTSAQLSEEERTELRKILHSYPLQSDPGTLNFHNRILQNVSRAFIYSLLGEKEKDFHCRRLNLEIFSEHPHFQQSQAFHYIAILRNYIGGCLEEEKYELVLETVRKAEAFAEKEGQMQPHLSFFHQAELEACFLQGQLEAIIEKVEPEIRRHLKRFYTGQERVAMVMYCYLAITHQLLGHDPEVQAYLRLLKEAENDLYLYFFDLIYTLELINHFEAEDFTSIERTLRSLARKMDKLPPRSELFQALLELFHQLYREPFEKKSLARAFQAQLDQYQHEFFHYLFFSFRLDQWLQAVANGRKFIDQFRLKTMA